MSYIGANKIGGMYLGSTEIAKAYLGSTLIFEKGGGGSGTFTDNIASYDDTDYKWASIGDYDFIGRGYDAAASTLIYVPTAGNEAAYIYVMFDTSSIPQTARILSAELKVKAQAQTYSGMTEYKCNVCKGYNIETYENLSTTASVYTFDLSAWSLADINQLKVQLYYKRGTNVSARFMRLYGATLVVQWES